MNELPTSRPVVVGIDGSKAAIHAALWAVDEAVSRDVPLRLLYAVDHSDAQDAEVNAMAGRLAAAETAIRRVLTSIEGTGPAVKIETEIAQGAPIGSLIRASASASMVCVGAVGLRHFQAGRMGSTAAALAISARCPVAIIRGQHDHPAQPPHEIVVEIDHSAENGVLLGAAMEEAQLRNSTVHAVVRAQTTLGDDEEARDCDRRARADLDRRLARWRRRYPNLAVDAAVIHGDFLDYLAHNCRTPKLAVVSARNHEHLNELFGPIGSSILQGAECSLLIADHQHL
ncbi:universal stress protein [Mycobacterium sp. Aquia_213]|uniref:universal stress protein n=1 Tax=Mycobacterium sp. Aquia_213 TaxID=2991728 RepID=UPI0022701DFE|nr:universal stress protein [Mycobacterium sp. Aquia_213]WAC93821.1 universal stress protein [Mycobacterium sp. Aquia_213]